MEMTRNLSFGTVRGQKMPLCTLNQVLELTITVGDLEGKVDCVVRVGHICFQLG
jgi:hypothetical protein